MTNKSENGSIKKLTPTICLKLTEKTNYQILDDYFKIYYQIKLSFLIQYIYLLRLNILKSTFLKIK